MNEIIEIKKTAIYRQLEELLEMAKTFEEKGKLNDGNKTVTSIEETMERLERLEELEWLKQLAGMEPEAQDINFLEIIANIKCCENFPCGLLRLLLIHNDPETRSPVYRTLFERCADFHPLEPLSLVIDKDVLLKNYSDNELLAIVIADGVRGSKRFKGLGYPGRRKLRGILGL